MPTSSFTTPSKPYNTSLLLLQFVFLRTTRLYQRRQVVLGHLSNVALARSRFGLRLTSCAGWVSENTNCNNKRLVLSLLGVVKLLVGICFHWLMYGTYLCIVINRLCFIQITLGNNITGIIILLQAYLQYCVLFRAVCVSITCFLCRG